MTVSVDINKLHREFWQQRFIRTQELLSKPHLVAIVAKREAEKSRFVKLATSEVIRVERIRNQKSFESELEGVAEEYGDLPVIKAQRRRARKPRGKITDTEETLNQVIEKLVTSREHLHSPAHEIWPHLYARLDELQLNPREVRHPTDSKKRAYRYEFNRKIKTITFGRFANLVSEFRQKSR
jgi:hypothetical protein